MTASAPPPFATTFGARLRQVMLERGRSVNWLAANTRVTRRWICRLRAGSAKSGPSPYVVDQLAAALGCSPSWLLFGEMRPSPAGTPDSQVVVEDLGSTNGTAVNGQIIDRTNLNVGDH